MFWIIIFVAYLISLFLYLRVNIKSCHRFKKKKNNVWILNKEQRIFHDFGVVSLREKRIKPIFGIFKILLLTMVFSIIIFLLVFLLVIHEGRHSRRNPNRIDFYFLITDPRYSLFLDFSSSIWWIVLLIMIGTFFAILFISYLLMKIIIKRNKTKFIKIQDSFYNHELKHFLGKVNFYKHSPKHNRNTFLDFPRFKTKIEIATEDNKIYKLFPNVNYFIFEYYFWLNKTLSDRKLFYSDDNFDRALRDFDDIFFSLILENIENFKKNNIYDDTYLDMPEIYK